MDREIDLGEPCGRFVLLMAVERDPPHGVVARVFNEVAGLDEHPGRAAGGVEDSAVVGLDHVDDGLDNRWRREELVVVVRTLLREFCKEIFVNAAEHVARGCAQRLGIEGPHHLFQDIVLEALVVLRKLACERREVGFHGFHGGGHGSAEISVIR